MATQKRNKKTFRKNRSKKQKGGVRKPGFTEYINAVRNASCKISS